MGRCSKAFRLCNRQPANFVGGNNSQDCLYLIVRTPEWPAKSREAVMVWFDGGRNFTGAASDPFFDGKSLARQGVLLVTAQHRHRHRWSMAAPPPLQSASFLRRASPELSSMGTMLVGALLGCRGSRKPCHAEPVFVKQPNDLLKSRQIDRLGYEAVGIQVVGVANILRGLGAG